MTTFFCHLTKEWVDGNFGKPRRPEAEPEPVKPSGSDFSIAQMSDMVGPEYAKWLTAHPPAPLKGVITHDPKVLAKFQIDTRGTAKPVESPNKRTWFDENPLPGLRGDLLDEFLKLRGEELVQDIGLVEALRRQVREMKKGVPQMIGQMRGTLSKLEAIHRRLIRKPGETTTLLLDAVQGMIDKAKHRLTLAEQGLKDLDEVDEELARWDEEFVRQIMPPRDLSNYFTGDTSVFFRKY